MLLDGSIHAFLLFRPPTTSQKHERENDHFFWPQLALCYAQKLTPDVQIVKLSVQFNAIYTYFLAYW